MPPKLRVSGGEGALCCDLEYETTGLFGDGDVLGLQLTACSVDVNRCRAGRNCAFLWKLRIAQFQLISLLSFVLIAAELWGNCAFLWKLRIAQFQLIATHCSVLC